MKISKMIKYSKVPANRPHSKACSIDFAIIHRKASLMRFWLYPILTRIP